MKIAFSTSGRNLDAPMDKRFGRASMFLVFDTDKQSFEVIDNMKNLNAEQGAGIQSAETVVRSGAGALVSGHCGPKAFRVMQAAGVKIYNTDAATVSEALDLYSSGKLVQAQAADVSGHW